MYFSFSSPPNQIVILSPNTEIKYQEKSIVRAKGQVGDSPGQLICLSYSYHGTRSSSSNESEVKIWTQRKKDLI